MFARTHAIIKQTFIYGLFAAGSAAVPFLLLPVLTRYISPTGYGIIATINVVIVFLGILFRLEVQSALKREYVAHKSDFAQYLGASLTIPLVIFGALCAIFAVAYPFLGEVLTINRVWIFGLLIISLGNALSAYLSSLYQIRGQAVCSGLWDILTSASILLGALILVAIFKLDWQGRILPMLVVATFVQIPVSLYLIYRIVPYKLNVNWQKIRSLLSFSAPLVPVALTGYILQHTDRLILVEMTTLEVVGLYTVAGQVASVIVIAYGAFLPAWEAFVMNKLNENTSQAYADIKFIFILFLLGLAAVALSVVFVLPHVMPYMLGDRFMSSMEYLPWIASAMFVRGLFGALSPFLCHARQTKIITYINFLLVALYLGLNYILISANGAMGAAQAGLVVSFVGFCLMSYFTMKYLKTYKVQRR